LEQKASKFVSVNVVGGHADNELSEVAHGRKEMTSTRFSGSSAGAPEIAVQDKHGRSDGPAEENFAVSTDALVSEDAMSAFLDPVDNILTTAGPKEAHADAKKGFVYAEMTSDRAAMEDIEDEATQGRWHDDKEERSAGLETLADDEAAMVDAEVVVARKLLEGGVKAGDDGGVPSGVGGEVAE
jgi:hypothetical protein